MILPNLLGYIFDILVQILSRIGEVRLQELPRMADFAEMGELIARCLGYKRGVFTSYFFPFSFQSYNSSIQTQEAITGMLSLVVFQSYNSSIQTL